MLNLKYSAIAALVLGSQLAFAGTMGPVCAPGNVTVPCEQQAWDVGIQALYLKPGFNDQDGYIGQFSNPLITHGTLVDNESVWGWGFKLEGSYHFNTGNDLTLNWYHLHDNSDTRVFPVNYTPLNGLPNTNDETYTLNPHWDAVNAEFGQHVDMNNVVNLRFHGGAQYARANVESSTIGEVTDGPRYSFGETNKFNGFGPRVGADVNIALGKGLGLYVDGAGAILAGTSKINQTFTTNITGLNLVALNGSTTAIVPALDAKLGFNYNVVLGQGNLLIDAGYMWVNYFNAITTTQLDSSDFGVQGPYFGVKWIGTLA